MTHLAHQYAEPLFNFWNGVFHVMMSMTEWIMKFPSACSSRSLFTRSPRCRPCCVSSAR
jgi:hypothetical protein